MLGQNFFGRTGSANDLTLVALLTTPCWLAFVTCAFIAIKGTAAKACIPWMSAPLSFGIIVISDYFINFVFLQQKLSDWEFWFMASFDFIMLVLRDSDSYYILSDVVTKLFGLFGHCLVMLAEVAAGNTDHVAEQIERTTSIPSVEDRRKRNKKHNLQIQRERVTVQISSLCIVSEVSSSLAVLCLVVMEYLIDRGKNADLLGDSMLTTGLGDNVRLEAMKVMLVMTAVDFSALVVSKIIVKRRHRAIMCKQAELQLPGVGVLEKQSSTKVMIDNVQITHTRWKSEIWTKNLGALLLMGIFTFGACTISGALFVLMDPCRGECGSCSVKEALKIEGRTVSGDSRGAKREGADPPAIQNVHIASTKNHVQIVKITSTPE
eukprot:CAMPEP_0182521730 /NCGR_PEP_ID=MMETSP1321-20130603/46271_1 /TAXON_ID=91990 /ORGANISM="Bolidomonas sp., Strain RCC1657" /LENGTH=377 /DNA_ID=CAMNT_0024729763 /DNA_START=1108 /DNA_END=2239 /DNA_ORIENTATION=-